jgi:type I restriction enzyme S subunit
MSSNQLSSMGNFVTAKIPNNQLSASTYVGNDNLLSNFQGVSESSYVPESGSSTEFQIGDILIGNIRPYLRKIWIADRCGGASNDVLVFRTTIKADSEFVYYCLTSDDFISHTMMGSKGTKMPRGDKAHILKYEIPVFDKTERKVISSFFKNLDAKIANNLNICRNLESLGREYFNMSSVVGNKGKLKFKLADLLRKNTTKYKSSDESLTIDLSVMPSDSIILFDTNSSANFDTNLFELSKGDFLIGAIRPYLKKIGISPIRGAVTGTVLSFQSLDKKYDAFLLFLLDSAYFKQYLISCSKGTKMPVIDSDSVLNYEFSTSEEILEQFDTHYNFNDSIVRIIAENIELKKIKNKMLPLVISNRISLH